MRDPHEYSQDLRDLDEHFVRAEDAFEGSGEALEPVVAHERQLAIPEVALPVRATRTLLLLVGRSSGLFAAVDAGHVLMVDGFPARRVRADDPEAPRCGGVGLDRRVIEVAEHLVVRAAVLRRSGSGCERIT